MKRVIIIGSGFSSLSAACYMAREGHKVTLFEKNETLGGRARQMEIDGFRFDMGPTFYWMPDIFESFFSDFGKAPSDYYKISRLDPGYEIYFGKDDNIKQSADLETLKQTFEEIEPGSSRFLESFIRRAGFNYRVAIDKVVYKPGKSPLELIMPETASRVGQFAVSLSHTIRRNIKDERLRQMLEFPVLFLGAKPDKTPSFYRFMNYADIVLGSWHVEGGMVKVIDGMAHLAESMGASIHRGANVERIVVEGDSVSGVVVDGEFTPADIVISGADYHHTEMLLPPAKRNYTENYWARKLFAPSAILYYIALSKPVENVSHHTLFFDTSFQEHAANIYDKPGWPEKPMFYASFPSKSDTTLAPAGGEVAIILIPAAAGLIDNQEVRERYFDQVMGRMESLTGQEIRSSILFHRSYAATDFMKDYNSYKGNAYGLANILLQTAFLKPKVANRHLHNLFYTGQLTVPGPGVPTALISGKVAAGCALKSLTRMK